MSKDGSTFVFTCNGNPSGGNSDGSYELFITDGKASSIEQITDDKDPERAMSLLHRSMRVSQDGRVLAFSARARLGDSEGENTAYVYDTQTRRLRRLAPLKAGQVTVSGDGKWIFLVTTADILNLGIKYQRRLYRLRNDIDAERIEGIVLTLIPTNFSGSRLNEVVTNYSGDRVFFVTDCNFLGLPPGTQVRLLSGTTTRLGDSK